MGVYKRERERESTIPYPVVSCLGIVRKYVFEILRERESLSSFFVLAKKQERERDLGGKERERASVEVVRPCQEEDLVCMSE